MATYLELRSLLRGQSELIQKVEAAVIIAADDVLKEPSITPNHANRLLWAKRAFTSFTQVAQEMLPAMIAANKRAAIDAIRNASDSQVQASVDAAVDTFATDPIAPSV